MINAIQTEMSPMETDMQKQFYNQLLTVYPSPMGLCGEPQLHDCMACFAFICKLSQCQEKTKPLVHVFSFAFICKLSQCQEKRNHWCVCLLMDFKNLSCKHWPKTATTFHIDFTTKNALNRVKNICTMIFPAHCYLGQSFLN